MRFINEEEGNRGTKYHFFIGKEEMNLLFNVLKHYKKTVPNTLLDTVKWSRLKNMEKILRDVTFKKENEKI